jgi:hypothetical protein
VNHQEAHLHQYQLVVPMTGTVAQARDFAQEIATEFGCEVEIKEFTTAGMVTVKMLSETGEEEKNG